MALLLAVEMIVPEYLRRYRAGESRPAIGSDFQDVEWLPAQLRQFARHVDLLYLTESPLRVEIASADDPDEQRHDNDEADDDPSPGTSGSAWSLPSRCA